MVHRPAKAPVVPTDGRYPYWTTQCGLRLDSEALAISDNPGEADCLKCSGKRGAKR